ncbi:DNA polymerase III subunit delta' [Clostridium fallax]|uniref:DNA polymerase III subunit delta' n=1 Tax=Clostridium fallax TaxID=1533 RepID=A0A1M4TLV7_9CLOT|nr:DNA polymerase III subunit delta' [Clostridium fallax]SHE45473.1 DNA polymerase-3 subunit delta' [Clostridium fallax]SQB22500.1 DNA polymerase III subunit delta' [Clostridium fallax]
MDFIGHEAIRKRVYNEIKNNALSHAHLIIGEDGIGKSLLAKEIALQIMGKNEDREYIDIVHYKPSKLSFGVDDVRSIISEINKKPYEGNKKVIIIHEGNKLTIQAQNALLKTIEEPPKGVFIIILCESGELILDTVKSRCQIHKLSPLSKIEMESFINKNYNNLDDKLKNTLIAFSAGIPGRADKFLKDQDFKNIRDLALNILKDINIRDEKLVIKYGEMLSKYSDKIDDFLAILVSFIRDIIIYKEVENLSIIINGDKIDNIIELSNIMSYKKLKWIIEVIDNTRRNLKNNTNVAITFDVMLMNLLEV